MPEPTLSWLPSREPDALAQAATDLFVDEFGVAPTGVWAAPGRVNLIGEHIDYAGGASIPFALEQLTAVAVRPRADARVRAVSTLAGVGESDAGTDAGSAGDAAAAGSAGSAGDVLNRAEVALADVSAAGPRTWMGYIAGTIWAGLDSGVLSPGASSAPGTGISGFDIAVVSDVPVGSGLSSSAALECAVAVAAFELMTGRAPDDAERAQLVAACIRAENEVVGASTGGLDQNASLFGRAGSALMLDFSTGVRHLVPFDLAGAGQVLLIADTNAPHALNDGQYASRRGVIDEVQVALGQEFNCGEHASLRDIARAAGGADHAVAAARAWAESTGADAELVERRVRHVVEETDRTLRAGELLESNDLDGFKELMRDSHVSLRDLYEVTTPELDSAFAAAGEFGARMTGGGFGGAVIALVPAERAEATALAIATAAAEHGFPEPTFLLARPGDGARRLR